MGRQEKRLEVRLTEEELHFMKEKMKRAGIKNKSAYFRKMVIDGHLIQMDLSCVQEMIRLLRINVNNLNQCARRTNECEFVYLENIQSLQKQQKLMWIEMRKIPEEPNKLGQHWSDIPGQEKEETGWRRLD